jgi:phenylacetic acid degradation operon negative regulatory protein
VCRVKPRSIVFDLFGDYVRYGSGGEIRLRALTSLLDSFGVGESTVRVVMNRLRREEWFDARREGRETVYALNDRSWRLLDEGRARIFERASGPWDRRWSMVIYTVPESDRALREELRKELSWLGFGALAASTWVSPWDRLGAVEEHFGGSDVIRLDLLRCESTGLAKDREMVARCWDLDALNADYESLLRTYRPRLADYRAGRLEPRDALVERMRLTHDYRLFPFRTPDFPDELVPASWRGGEAHELFLTAHELLRERAEAYYRSVVGGRSPKNVTKS